MPYKRIHSAKGKTVGTKQTIKAIKKNLARVVYVADNADNHVIDPIIRACEEKKIPYVRVDSMKHLGKACGINVECATAAITEE
ncbi:large subunit ribosomal protein L7A [Desulfotomaculum arcticum]|uniref:Large subunit ribosomal protein L7A n=1 Tax=Desulfotruncus arcticus DSM 17038 TaxID=1121424 RepID=A0A1I2ZQ10_9FIRM|nr:ribosomal L7Ae/L30e/S12e/Gadd45 family protein [Desulfotruncus arcticus]SFH39705.1 large subunit ribosomal protein L7A [Desulfotomaculum arcticum] [Desulfotruncus arcticus DSM 17038]